MRSKYPAGTRFRILAKLKSKSGGAQFLYCHYNAPYSVIK